MLVNIHLISLTAELPDASLGDELGAVAVLALALLPLVSPLTADPDCKLSFRAL